MLFYGELSNIVKGSHVVIMNKRGKFSQSFILRLAYLCITIYDSIYMSSNVVNNAYEVSDLKASFHR